MATNHGKSETTLLHSAGNEVENELGVQQVKGIGTSFETEKEGWNSHLGS
jgi:hypothetical protein